MIFCLPSKYYQEAKEKGWIKKGWDIAEKNNQYKRLKNFADKGFSSEAIGKMDKDYWMVGSLALDEVIECNN